MTTTLFKQVGYTLSKLIDDIQMGEIGLPDIQRPFVWKNITVCNLFDSMYRGYPVGYFLFWENQVGKNTRQIGANTHQKVPQLLIVDGQQRLTSLYAVLKGIPVVRESYEVEQIEIAFRPTDGSFQVCDAAIRKDMEYLPNISSCTSGKIIGGGSVASLKKRSSLPKTIVSEVDAVVERRLGKGGAFWDGPYKSTEAASVSRLSEDDRGLFGTFSSQHEGEEFYVCFQYVVLDGFTAHGAEHASGYIADSIFIFRTGGEAKWFEIGRANQSSEPTRGAVH